MAYRMKGWSPFTKNGETDPPKGRPGSNYRKEEYKKRGWKEDDTTDNELEKHLKNQPPSKNRKVRGYGDGMLIHPIGDPPKNKKQLAKLMNRDMWIHPKIEGKKRNNTPTPSWKEQIDKGMIKYAKK